MRESQDKDMNTHSEESAHIILTYKLVCNHMHCEFQSKQFVFHCLYISSGYIELSKHFFQIFLTLNNYFMSGHGS